MIRPIFGPAPPFSNGRPFPKGDVERTVLFLSCVPNRSPPAGILTHCRKQEICHMVLVCKILCAVKFRWSLSVVVLWPLFVFQGPWTRVEQLGMLGPIDDTG